MTSTDSILSGAAAQELMEDYQGYDPESDSSRKSSVLGSSGEAPGSKDERGMSVNSTDSAFSVPGNEYATESKDGRGMSMNSTDSAFSVPENEFPTESSDSRERTSSSDQVDEDYAGADEQSLLDALMMTEALSSNGEGGNDETIFSEEEDDDVDDDDESIPVEALRDKFHSPHSSQTSPLTRQSDPSSSDESSRTFQNTRSEDQVASQRMDSQDEDEEPQPPPSVKSRVEQFQNPPPAKPSPKALSAVQALEQRGRSSPKPFKEFKEPLPVDGRGRSLQRNQNNNWESSKPSGGGRPEHYYSSSDLDSDGDGTGRRAGSRGRPPSYKPPGN